MTRRSINLIHLWLTLALFSVPAVAFSLAGYFRFGSGYFNEVDGDLFHYVGWIITVTVVWALVVEYLQLNRIDTLLTLQTGIKTAATATSYCLILVLSLILVSCTTTKQGKSIDRANYIDMGTTGIGLAGGASEANPLGLAILPIKVSMGKITERVYPDDCYQRAQVAAATNTVVYGASANNFAIVAGLSGPAAPIVGIIGGITYYKMRNRVEPGTFDCVPPELQGLAKAYSDGDAKAFAAEFTIDGSVNELLGREAIEAAYSEFFAGSKKRQMWLLDWGGTEAYSFIEVDKKNGYMRVKFDFAGDKISRLEYSEWLTYEQVYSSTERQP